MTVTLSQESYDAMLDDIKKLRERNKDLEEWFNIDDCIDFAKNEHNRQENETLNIALRKLIKKAQAFDEIDKVIKWHNHNDRYEFEGQLGKIQSIIKETNHD